LKKLYDINNSNLSDETILFLNILVILNFGRNKTLTQQNRGMLLSSMIRRKCKHPPHHIYLSRYEGYSVDLIHEIAGIQDSTNLLN